jgi:hypothetical protein
MKEERPNEIAGDSGAGEAHDSDNRPGPGTVERNAEQPLRVRKAGGPRTPEGKQRTKLNALKYGIFSDIALLPGESRVKYNLLLNGFCESFLPVGKFEEVLVEDMATNRWHVRRVIQAEVAEFRKVIDFMQWEQQTRGGRRQVDAEPIAAG